MTDMPLESALEGPLGQLRSMLEADGYGVEWRPTGPASIELEIVAGADACEECLVPKAVMLGIAGNLLAPAGVTASEIVYPAEGAAH